jgi:hypothetical protein
VEELPTPRRAPCRRVEGGAAHVAHGLGLELGPHCGPGCGQLILQAGARGAAAEDPHRQQLLTDRMRGIQLDGVRQLSQGPVGRWGEQDVIEAGRRRGCGRRGRGRRRDGSRRGLSAGCAGAGGAREPQRGDAEGVGGLGGDTGGGLNQARLRSTNRHTSSPCS